MSKTDDVLYRVGGWLERQVFGSAYPKEWHTDRHRLDDWAHAHSISSGDVWAVSPGYGHETPLWAPGSLAVGEARPAVEPYATRPEDPSYEKYRLADVEGWMRPWIEQATGGRVVEMVEGFRWFGDTHDAYELVYYARVA